MTCLSRRPGGSSALPASRSRFRLRLKVSPQRVCRTAIDATLEAALDRDGKPSRP
jgi:hypothetical protein